MQGGKDGEEEAESGGGQVLDLPVHPLLQTTNANRDLYSAQSKASGVSTSQSKGLHNYKPSIIASYGSFLEDHMSDKAYLSGNENSKQAGSSALAAKEANEEDNSDQPASNAYSADVAALIW